MTTFVSRRDFVTGMPGVCTAATLFAFGHKASRAADQDDAAASPRTSPTPIEFPRQNAAQVKEIVTVAHFNVERVKSLVEQRPALAKAAWDWGFGDWETAIGAASHMGRRDIAAVLIEACARPTVFTFAMLGNLDAVRAAVDAQPGLLTLPGPHGISLRAHAEAGGSEARDVLDYLNSRGAPAELESGQDVPQREHEAVQGTYAFGTAEDERLEVAERHGDLMIRRTGDTQRRLVRVGAWEYHPTGAPAVRIRFDATGESPRAVTVTDAELEVTARRIP